MSAKSSTTLVCTHDRRLQPVINLDNRNTPRWVKAHLHQRSQYQKRFHLTTREMTTNPSEHLPARETLAAVGQRLRNRHGQLTIPPVSLYGFVREKLDKKTTSSTNPNKLTKEVHFLDPIDDTHCYAHVTASDVSDPNWTKVPTTIPANSGHQRYRTPAEITSASLQATRAPPDSSRSRIPHQDHNSYTGANQDPSSPFQTDSSKIFAHRTFYECSTPSHCTHRKHKQTKKTN